MLDLTINKPKLAHCLRIIDIHNLYLSFLPHKHEPLPVHAQYVRQMTHCVSALILTCLSHSIKDLAAALLSLAWLANDDPICGGARCYSKLATHIGEPLEFIDINVEVFSS